jgi:hypothetical protein
VLYAEQPRFVTPWPTETAILTYGYWQRKFGGNPAAVGGHLIVDGKVNVTAVNIGERISRRTTCRISLATVTFQPPAPLQATPGGF